MNSTADTLRAAVAESDTVRILSLVATEPQLPMADSGNGQSILLAAQYDNAHEAVDALLSGGVTIGLFEAAALGRADRLSEILAEEPAAVQAYAPDGFTPLHVAAHFCRRDAVVVLLEGKADPTAVTRNDGKFTPLHSGVAARRGTSAEIVAVARLLLEHGSPVDAVQPGGGFTPLHTAAGQGNADLVALLLEFGADTSVTDAKGRDAAAHADKRGYADIATLLRA